MRVLHLAACNSLALRRRFTGLALVTVLGTAICVASLGLTHHASGVSRSRLAEGVAWRSIDVNSLSDSQDMRVLSPDRVRLLATLPGVRSVEPTLRAGAGIKTTGVPGVLFTFTLARPSLLPPIVKATRPRVFPLKANEVVLPAASQGTTLVALLGKAVPITFTQYLAPGQGRGALDRGTVVAVYDPSWQLDGRNAAYASQSAVVKWAAAVAGTTPAAFLDQRGYSGAIVVADSSAAVPQVLKAIQDSGFSATSIQQELTTLPGTLRLVDVAGRLALGALLGFVLLGSLSLSGALVKQRTREIGLLKAVGYRDRAVLGMFLVEVALVGVGCAVAGLALGVAIGAFLSRVLSRSPELAGYMGGGIAAPSPGMGSLLVAGIVGGLVAGALAPARRAARMEPSRALRDW